MPFNGSGTFTRNQDYTADRDAGAPSNIISATKLDEDLDGIATGLTNCITRDGQSTPTANIPMGSFKFTGLTTGSARTDSTSLGQIQDGKINWVDGGGTADAITATYSPAITTLVDGQLCFVRATAANATTTPTFAPNGLTARTIVKSGGSALAAGDIVADGHELILRYDLTNTRWELLNPAANIVAASETVAGKIEIATQSETDTGTDDARAVTPLKMATRAMLQGKHAVPILAAAMTANTTNGAASGTTETTTNKVMLKTLDFDQTTQEGAQFSIPMPVSWNEGAVTFVPYWTASAGSGGVVWELRAVALSDDDASDTAFGTGQTSTDTLIATGDIHVGPESAAITIAGTPAANDIVFFQIRRNVADGSDTLTGDAKLIAVKLFLTYNAGNDA